MADGPLAFLMYQSHQRSRVQCARCGYIFRGPRIPTPPVEHFATVVVLVAGLAVAATIAFIYTPYFADSYEPFQWVVNLENQISRNPRGVVVGGGTLIAALLTIAIIGSIFARIGLRRAMKAEYRLKPRKVREPVRFPIGRPGHER